MFVDLVVPADVDEEALQAAIESEAQRLRWSILHSVGARTEGTHAVIVGVEMAAVQAAFGMVAKGQVRDGD